VGRETVRIVLARHDLKPWREKNVVRPRNQHGVRGPHGRCLISDSYSCRSWKFTVADARRVFRYNGIITQRSER